MEQREQKIALEAFLTHHGVEMLPTARLSHYGRRFRAYFPGIAIQANPSEAPWTTKAIDRLAAIVSELDPAAFTKNPNARPVRVAKKYRDTNKTKAFLLSWEWRSLRYEVLTERGRRCECCGATASDARIEVDHVKPISKFWGLRLDKANLQVLCRDCNKGKGNRRHDDFRGAA